MSDEESMCIFCEELIPADSVECPHCSKKPFSGMYFDSETYKIAEELEKKGELEEAWKLLYEEWIQHGDYDYYDDKMYFELLDKMHELYERNPSLLRQRVDLIKDYWRGAAYYAHFVGKRDIEEGLDIVRKINRKDLEEELIEYLDNLNRGS
jgi:RNA polymerase subunit RPABC4/transcription elongation factor Spt4